MDGTYVKMIKFNSEDDLRVRIAAAQMRITQGELIRRATVAFLDANRLGDAAVLPGPADAEAVPVMEVE